MIRHLYLGKIQTSFVKMTFFLKKLILFSALFFFIFGNFHTPAASFADDVRGRGWPNIYGKARQWKFVGELDSKGVNSKFSDKNLRSSVRRALRTRPTQERPPSPQQAIEDHHHRFIHSK